MIEEKIKELVAALKNEGVSEFSFSIKFGQEEKANKKQTTCYKTDADSFVHIDDNELLETPDEENSAELAGRKFRETPGYENYYSTMEICRIAGISQSMVSLIVAQSHCPWTKSGRTTYYDLKTIVEYRKAYEKDLLIHDGSRPGKNKFIVSTLERLLK